MNPVHFPILRCYKAGKERITLECRIVVRHDSNENQSFFDPIQAPTAEECKALSDQLRGEYSEFVCMLDLIDLNNMVCLLRYPQKTEKFVTAENVAKLKEEY